MYDNMEPIRNTEMHFWMLIKKVIYLHTIFKNLLQVWDSFQWHSGHKHMSKTINSVETFAKLSTKACTSVRSIIYTSKWIYSIQN